MSLFSKVREIHNEIRDVIFDPDSEKHQVVRERMEQFVDRDFCADYKYSTSIDVVHEECQQYVTINDMFH